MNPDDLSFLVTNADQMGQVLRGVRREMGLTQAQLGYRAGVPQKEVSKMETGAGRISVDRLFRFLSALELEIEIRSRKSSEAEVEW